MTLSLWSLKEILIVRPSRRRRGLMILPVTLIMFYLNPVAANIANLEDFESYSTCAFPAKWRSRREEAQKIYRVGQENGNRFLRAHANKQAV